MIYEEASEVEEVAVTAPGVECQPLPFFREFEVKPERDRACPAPWLQGFLAAGKISGSDRLSQAWAEFWFSHQQYEPTSAPLKLPLLSAHPRFVFPEWKKHLFSVRITCNFPVITIRYVIYLLLLTQNVPLILLILQIIYYKIKFIWFVYI